ncbi:MAG: hypothetical protein ACYCVL_05550 [Gemmatimonadaceae bacterium]
MNRIRTAGRWGRRWRVCAGLAGAALFARSAAGQSRVSAELAFESGNVHGGEFRRDLGKSMLLAGVDVRVGRLGGNEVRIGLAAEEPFLQGDVTTICVIGSHGQCLDPPPDVRSITATVGLRRTIAHRLALALSGGTGEVADMRWGNPRLAFTGRFDVALRALGGVYLTGGGRVVSWHDAGVSLHSYVQAYGIRIN